MRQRPAPAQPRTAREQASCRGFRPRPEMPTPATGTCRRSTAGRSRTCAACFPRWTCRRGDGPVAQPARRPAGGAGRCRLSGRSQGARQRRRLACPQLYRRLSGDEPRPRRAEQLFQRHDTADAAPVAIGGQIGGRHDGRRAAWQGAIDLDAPLPDFVPELAHSGYAGATLRQVLDMRSGVRFTEDYNTPGSDMTRIDIASGWRPPLPGGAPRDHPRRDPDPAARARAWRGVRLSLDRDRRGGLGDGAGGGAVAGGASVGSHLVADRRRAGRLFHRRRRRHGAGRWRLQRHAARLRAVRPDAAGGRPVGRQPDRAGGLDPRQRVGRPAAFGAPYTATSPKAPTAGNGGSMTSRAATSWPAASSAS